MYRSFTMAAVIAVVPISQKILTGEFDQPVAKDRFSFSFLSKIKLSESPLLPAAVSDSTATWTGSWLSKAQENIRKAEYNFTREEKLSAYCTPNRKNNFRFFYDEKGFSVEPMITKIPIGKSDPVKRMEGVKYKTIPNWKVRFNLGRQLLSKGEWRILNNKAEYFNDNVTVQYINGDDGMRQNFIINKPLSHNDELRINFSIHSKLKVRLLSSQLQFFHKKNNVLNYEDLKVWDANGKSIAATFKKAGKGKYYIQADTKDAVYPITIDPLSTTPATMLESNQASANLGGAVASAGDVNGDGYSDVIVGAYSYNNGQTSEGVAFIFHGSATGLSATAAAMVESNQSSALMGYAVAPAGDVNGDGYSDIIVAAPNYDNGQTDEGRVFVYHGSATGINTTAAVMIESNQGSASLGYSLASAGDVNGDGYSDIIAGAYNYDAGQTDEGRAYIYHGSATGINATPAAIVESNQVSAFLGYSVASAGDVNGDGYSDVIVGAHFYDNGESNEGAAFVYHGSATGINTTPAVVLEGNQASAVMGYSVASAGDVNGDGYSDIIVSAYQYDNGETDEGVAFVFRGSAAGVSSIPVAMLECNQASAYMGWSVNCAGDINGDGYSDVVVGAYHYDNGQSDEGAAFIYQGSATGINTTAVAVLESNQVNALMGTSVASAGDVNGDGFSDVIAGARSYDNGHTNEGAAFIYHGSSAGLSLTPGSIPDDANQAAVSLGFSVASAGDVNGDGYSDVIIGAPYYNDGANVDEGRAFVYHGSAAGLSATPNSTPGDANQANAWFGYSVTSAGDVNADGYSDIIIGANGFDDGINTDEGRVYVYHGSAAGISATPGSIRDDAGQNGAYFGCSVACAGDVNGDGYSDVIIGASGFDDGANGDEGRAFVYHGSAAGISATPNSTPDDANQAGAGLGYSVASAGDVNGDGYGDVIIGAYFFDDGANLNEGRAFVYHGSAAGLSLVPDNTPGDANQADAAFASSVACAGDVNGDGYSDVIIGAPYYNDGANADEGRVFVYHGSATGLSATPSITLSDANQANAWFGYSVASAGDVNGDGYNDVIVGASGFDNGVNTDEGRAFVYHGSSAGLSAIPGSICDDANQSSAFFGCSVAGAGDVNGDGYSDVIIGAYGFNDGINTDEGWSFVYNGNEYAVNKRNNLLLYNNDLITPVNSSNFVFANFGAGLFAKSFLGKLKGKLVWETRLNYLPYSGTPITNSTLFTSQQTGYTDLGINGTEIKNHISKVNGTRTMTKLRARVKYDPVTAITGQLYGPWRYVSAIIDANNMGILPVELISFKVAWLQKGKTAQISFSTDKESSLCCFDIEKGTDGFNFIRISSIPANNAPGIQSYSFIDNNATAKNQYYRLKIKGLQGQVEYSYIQQLQFSKATEIFVFPNPTADVLQLSLNNNYNKINIQILNSSGQVVKQENNMAVVNQIIRIPVHNLPSGNYWIRLQSMQQEQLLQFVKR